jgi:hypothetical protein
MRSGVEARLVKGGSRCARAQARGHRLRLPSEELAIVSIKWLTHPCEGMADFTIFYSWQMDVPLAINRDFIQKALDAAVQQLGNQFDIEEADRMTVEQGMNGVPGSPEVATMMFEKIGESAIFLGDVSLVGAVRRDRKLLKRVPNPNVSIEEGFAAGVLGWERVICVSNEHFGKNEEQAFDQRNRRFPISYRLAPNATNEETDNVSKGLIKTLVKAIDTVRKYELRTAERVLEQLNVSTIELLGLSQNSPFLIRPNNAAPAAPIPALKDLSVWDACLVRMQELRIVRTDLGLDDAHQPRYAYHWTAVGRKVIDLIIKKWTPPPAVLPAI